MFIRIDLHGARLVAALSHGRYTSLIAERLLRRVAPGKVYMIRAGLFRDVDVVLHWHPGNVNATANGGMLAVNSARFLFHGAAAHAAMAPERGRSALDAVMLMGNGLEFVREHIPSNSRTVPRRPRPIIAGA